MFRGSLSETDVFINGVTPVDLMASQHLSVLQLRIVRLIVFMPSAKEFELEHNALINDVLPEIQQCAAQANVELQLIEAITGEHDARTISCVTKLLRTPSTHLMCFLGDIYGQCMPLHSIAADQFEAMRNSVKHNDNDYTLLTRYYILDDCKTAEQYVLNDQLKMSDNDREQLNSIIRKASVQENQVDDAPQKTSLEDTYRSHNSTSNNLSSNLELITLLALQSPRRAIFVLRQFHGGAGLKADKDSQLDGDVKMNELKKLVADSSATVIRIDIKPSDAEDLNGWLNARTSEIYLKSFTQQITECLRQLVVPMHTVPWLLQNDVQTIARMEQEIHCAYASNNLPIKWIARQAIESEITAWISDHNKGAYIQVCGGDLTGKTATICRLFALLKNSKCYVIPRFANLTNESNFANELWHNICTTLFTMCAQHSTALCTSFHLSDTIAILKQLLQKLDRPVFVLIDDAHLIRHGRMLSVVDKPIRKMLPNLVLITTTTTTACTNTNAKPMQAWPTPILFQLPNFSATETIELVHNFAIQQKYRLNEKHLETIANAIDEGSIPNTLAAHALAEEFIWLKLPPVKLEAEFGWRFASLEREFGQMLVRMFAQMLTVTPHGLTAQEILDALLRCAEHLEADADRVPLLLNVYAIIDKFGCLVTNFACENRLVYKWSHQIVACAAYRRYLSNTAELKKAHCLLVDVFTDASLSQFNVSQQTCDLSLSRLLKREDGTVNTRVVHNLWYHLLHAGDLDALKKFALSRFEFVDACIRACGILQLLSIYEDCTMQVLHHDLQVLTQQVLLPSLSTIVKDINQLASELIGRLRYTRAENSHYLNAVVEQAMSWVDLYGRQSLLVFSFTLPNWKSSRTIIHPTHNHQHLLVTGDETSLGIIYMYHIASQFLVRTFTGTFVLTLKQECKFYLNYQLSTIVTSILGHTERVTSISVSSNGQFFVSTSVDCTVRIWNFTHQDEAFKVLKPHRGRPVCSLISSNCHYLITGGTDSCANVISVDNWELKRSFQEHTGTVVSLALTSDDEFLVTGSGDFIVMIWNLNTGKLAVRLPGLMAPVSCISMTNNDAFVAVACEDETLRVFGTVSGQELHELSGHDGKVVSMAAAHDDCQLFVGNVGKIYAYDIHNGKLLDVLDCVNMQTVTSLQLTNDDYFLVSACGSRIDVWNIQNRKHDSSGTVKNHGIVSGICMARDEKSAACGTTDGVVALWDVDVCQCIWTMIQRKDISVICIKFSNDCLCLLSGDAEGQINLWDSTNGKLIRDINYHTKAIRSIFCLSDGVRVLSADQSNTVFIWNLLADENSEAERILAFTGIQPPLLLPHNNVHLIGYSPISKKELRIWMIDHESLVLKTKIHHNEEITCYSTTSSGTLLVTGSADLSLKLWQIDTGFLIQVLVGHEDVVSCCAITENERLVVSGGRDSQIIVWKVSTGDAALSLQAEAPINSIVVTADASVLIAGTISDAKCSDNATSARQSGASVASSAQMTAPKVDKAPAEASVGLPSRNLQPAEVAQPPMQTAVDKEKDKGALSAAKTGARSLLCSLF